MSKTSAEIRSSFLQFFGERGHSIEKSASLLPQNDPTLMFTNAGMVPFKDVFTGKEQRSFTRATSSQKCIRISGKHNDLEAVGPSPRHHTFFEMLGNFSFGDYFKEDAIVFAWEYLTRTLGLPKERLCITYFRGDESIPRDDDACAIWKKLTGWGDDRIIPLGADNFWQMGDTGPCGPSSEIFFCNGPNIDPSRVEMGQDEDGNGWMEIWNLVFMQFERSVRDGAVVTSSLPKPSIDTGAGLERLASVVQGKRSNYDVDVLHALVSEAASLSGKAYGGSMRPDDISMRVIADHVRTSAFLIAEGVMPDRTGREYVLRRVMRRAIRHGHRLGIAEPFLHTVAGRVVAEMGAEYPELKERAELITNVIEAEEVRFRQTIERGLSLLSERFALLEQADQKTLPGKDAFQLYDTFGFPLDLTQVICKERGFEVDESGYEQHLEQARARSSFVSRDASVESVYREALERVPGGEVIFTGYDRERETAQVVALIQDGAFTEGVEAGSDVEVVLGRTPFYGEGGGQVGDQGMLHADGVTVRIHDTQRPLPGLWVLRGRVERGVLQVGSKVDAQVDNQLRSATRRNHSATHLLHWALRRVLGAHAQQKGSLVGPERLRFDFTHNAPLTRDQIREIEDLVNEQVLLNHPIVTEVLSLEQARQRGAMMIFEEKYGDVVRMLTMGPSAELCGGTHARATGDLGLVKIVSDQGVAAGVRRLFATTGHGSLHQVQEMQSKWEQAAVALRATPENLLEKLDKLIEQRRLLEKEVDALKKALLTGAGGGGVEQMLAGAKRIGPVNVLGVRTSVSDRAALRELSEQLRDKLGDAVVLVGAPDGDKASLVVTVSKSMTERFKAGELIKVVAAKVDGSGGGRPDMAQAGGTNVAGLDDAVREIYSAVEAVQNSH